MIFKILKIELIALAVLLLLSLTLSINYEGRNVFWQLFIDGHLFYIIFIGFLLTLFVLGIQKLQEKRWGLGIVLTSLSSLIFITLFLPVILAFRSLGYPNRDVLVYSNGEEKIVVQYFETGVTGNPRFRAIQTTGDLSSSLRKIEKITLRDKFILDFISSASWPTKCEWVPDVLEYKEEIYKISKCEWVQ